MKYISVCSGIEAASCAWQPLGWEAVAFAEIEPFPCRVLQHRFPSVPNVGDMTKINGGDYSGAIDLLVGGTPCQDFSVAGKRAGLDGKRSGLARHFIRLLNEIYPKYFIWENVPGCLTTNGGKDFRMIMEHVQNAGYFLDVDILDAQFFGVPQRRRRVFVCGFRADLLQKKTIFSATTIAKCLQGILGKLLEELKPLSEKERISLDSQSVLSDGLRRKMSWFLKHGTNTEDLIIWRNVLIEAFQKLVREQKNSVYLRGDINLSEHQEDLLTVSLMEFLSGLTEESLKKNLDESFYLMKSFITSTGTKITTRQAIYIFSQTVLNTQKLICLLRLCYQDFCLKDTLSSTTLQGFMNYARQTTSTLLGDAEHHNYWCDFIRQAEHINNFIEYIRKNADSGAVLFEPASLCRDTPESRKKREGITQSLTGCLGAGGSDDNRAQAGFYIPGIVGQAMSCKWSKGTSGPAGDEHHNLICAPVTTSCYADNAAQESKLIPSRMGVRRLTPLECERLQGFPDGWTDIPGASDTARYKALGNSMAVPVMRWIGERIERVEKQIGG